MKGFLQELQDIWMNDWMFRQEVLAEDEFEDDDEEQAKAVQRNRLCTQQYSRILKDYAVYKQILGFATSWVSIQPILMRKRYSYRVIY